MFSQQLRDFDLRPRRDARHARVNVELEQSAHTIDSNITGRFVKRSLAVVVDRVLIDAVQRTQQLARARVAIKRCEMQRRPTFFVLKNDFGHETTGAFKTFVENNRPVVVSLVSRRAPSNQRQRRIGAPAGSCLMYWLQTLKSTRGEIEANR